MPRVQQANLKSVAPLRVEKGIRRASQGPKRQERIGVCQIPEGPSSVDTLPAGCVPRPLLFLKYLMTHVASCNQGCYLETSTLPVT